MARDVTRALLRAACFASLAIALLLALRTPLRRWSGATLAYQAWLIVPLVSFAALLPVRSMPVVLATPALRPVQAFAAQAAPLATARVDGLLVIWACGLVASVAWLVLGHRAFLRHAGRLTRVGDVYFSQGDAGPASVGLFRPRIILPHDFAQQYSAGEQALVIAHEQAHIGRRDALANLLAALFQCLFWFNPLVHLGALHLRQDQELACDALVMQRHPQQRRTYAQALLKSHAGAFDLRPGIRCHWKTHHPTKERLMHLQHTPPGTLRRFAGRCLLALLAAGALTGTLGVRAQEAATAPSYSVAMTFDAGGERSTPRVVTRAGEQFAVASGEWRIEMSVRPGQTAGDVWLKGRVLKGAEVVSAPTLLARLGEQATIKVGEAGAPFSVAMVVTRQP